MEETPDSRPYSGEENGLNRCEVDLVQMLRNLACRLGGPDELLCSMR